MANKYIYNVWKRKTASAQVKLFEGKWKNIINWIDSSEYIKRADLFGVSAQAEAIRHGLSRNLASSDEGFKKLLKAAWFLTRDSRKVERKKPGKKKARKSPSWSKR